MNNNQITPIFLDTEFTSLSKAAELISFACVSEGKSFYAEFTDYNKSNLNSWIKANVIDNLILKNHQKINIPDCTALEGDSTEIKKGFLSWLSDLKANYKESKFQFWADVPHYDWVLFSDLLGGSLNLSKYGIDYMVMDLATLLYCKGKNPNQNRNELLKDIIISNGELKPHNALHDAFIAQELYKKYYEQK